MEKTDRQLELKLCAIGEELLMEENPVEKSRAGSNVVFHYCDPLERRASYAGCLHTLDAVEEGRGDLVPDCQAAIAAGTCPARKMRLEELRAGRALYYVDYHELTKRRGIKYAQDRESEQTRYRRPNTSVKFVPTQLTPVAHPAPEKTAVEVKSEPTKVLDCEIDTNIMEKVLKKRLSDDSTASGKG